ncbi:mitochondrial sodium/calcium exchanger protein isoform X2 [Eurytemora carolleeae]|uniref:mitochondrial sodium/calcium exchanger protein isoform X2 n=1 Tax=Eurytemora carolleeae TaxID=1294199 RepID=UPI000C7855CB|nr:mitochondrial sodium/calcium exchanger protein isoform X2 [Eurytemora carolleeae]|eukprot:XP_023334030.1 mitochondrial sodium/calcium exchanger protein-like isoform X2 [Eurytemora affinis]
MKEIWRTHKHPWFGFGGFPEVLNENISGDCDLIHNLDWKDRCDFVLHNENCLDVDGFINYISALYCNFGEHLFPLGLVLYLVWLVLLFIALAVSADDFFCPAIQVISTTLRLSQNIAGVTIMALGNGAPDIFSSLAGISAARPELVFGELFGAGVFVTTVVAGSVAITKPFKVMERPFLRDVSFYLMAGFWAFYIFWRQEIRLGDALGFLALYIVYIAVVIIGRYIHSKTRTTEPYYSVQTNEVDEQIVPTHREGTRLRLDYYWRTRLDYQLNYS